MLTDHGGNAVYKNFRFVAREPPEVVVPKPTAPFLGNAIRTSCADQNSIVVWTRTTAQPAINTDRLEFGTIDKGDASEIGRTSDADKLLSVQLPAGAPGEVRLTYFPKLQRKSMKSTSWVTTSTNSDFTAEWKLDDLKPDREYAAVVEARPIGSDEPTAVVRRGFRTAPQPDDPN